MVAIPGPLGAFLTSSSFYPALGRRHSGGFGTGYLWSGVQASFRCVGILHHHACRSCVTQGAEILTKAFAQGPRDSDNGLDSSLSPEEEELRGLAVVMMREADSHH